MRTRNARNPKSPKRTPPASKTPPTPPDASQQPPSEPTVTPKRASSTRGKAVATNDATATTPVVAVKIEDDTTKVSPVTKSGAKRTVKRVIKRTVIRKTPKSSDGKTSQPAAVKVEEEDDNSEEVHAEKENLEHEDVGVSVKDDDENVADVAKSIEQQEPEMNDSEETETETEEPFEIEEPILENKETNDDKLLEIQEPEVQKLAENQETVVEKEKTVENQETVVEKEKIVEYPETVVVENEIVGMENDNNYEFRGEEDPQERLCLSDEEKDKDIADDEYEMSDDKVAENGELGLDDEQAEFTVAAEERKRRKEFEIFVGGLDRDATEQEVKRVFQYAGEVVEVRMNKELPTNKNKGYAFVRFDKKEHVARALSQMKNPVIHGKRCGTAPSEDNDTLFLGNICNTWTKEAIRQKLKDYNIDGVERITLVSDPQNEGLSRGFAFLEFSGHPDAMIAYKQLQKPDCIFGHPDRTAKVAFAEPLREPDPEVLAQVKSVFVDGLPPHWDEDIIREQLKCYGKIERIMLARNMSSAKRKDFGFVDFSTHEDALKCIDGVNKRDLGDEKMKVRARLSNPLPKTQAVKGGIAGGFLISHVSRAAGIRDIGRGALAVNRMHNPQGSFHTDPVNPVEWVGLQMITTHLVAPILLLEEDTVLEGGGIISGGHVSHMVNLICHLDLMWIDLGMVSWTMIIIIIIICQ